MEEGQEKVFTCKLRYSEDDAKLIKQEEGRAGGRSWNGAWQIKN
jgi:hypothetical protein